MPPLSHSAPFRSLLARKARRTLLKPLQPKLLLTLLPAWKPLKAPLLKPVPLLLTPVPLLLMLPLRPLPLEPTQLLLLLRKPLRSNF